LLFAAVDAFRSAAEVLAFAVSHFREYQRVFVPQYQVYFTEPAMIIALYRLHALGLQKLQRLLFGLYADVTGFGFNRCR
jgi:hypothetical protein